MASIESRLNELERKATETDTGYVFHILRAGREVEAPIHFTHHDTGEIYPVDYDFDQLKGYNVLFAEYGE